MRRNEPHLQIPHILRRVAGVAAAIVVAMLLVMVSLMPAQAQTFQILHTFTDQGDGGNPYAGVTIDADGNLYGTTTQGYTGEGSAFKMSAGNYQWSLSTLYDFPGMGDDGAFPYGGIIRGRSGVLYGTTCCGGDSQEGTVFELLPSRSVLPSVSAPWIERILHNFTRNGSDGVGPVGTLAMDAAGNLYGTTIVGGDYYDGAVFELTPSPQGWTESILYSFMGSDGMDPRSGVVLDAAGNLYGTTAFGGVNNCGTVFELTPTSQGWSETVLYSFQGDGDGCRPWAGVIVDEAGNVYGATAMTDSDRLDGGTVFELSPANGQWNHTVLHTFPGGYHSPCSEGWGSGPASSLTFDDNGVLYGTTQANGTYSVGNVFKLVPSSSGWLYTSVHDFNPADNDGLNPCGGVALDSNGNLYGTTFSGGQFPYLLFGVVWEINP